MKGALSNLLAGLFCLGIVFGSPVRLQGQTTMTLIATNTFTASNGVGTRSGPVLGRDGTVYISCYSSALGTGSVYAVYLTNGAFASKWTSPFQTAGKIDSSPALSADDSTLYVVSFDWNLYAINTADGSKKWAYPSANFIRSSPALGKDGSIYFVCQFLDGLGSNRWDVCAVSASGSTLWSFPSSPGTAYFGTGTPNLTVAADGTIYAGCFTPTNNCNQGCAGATGQGTGIMYAIGVTNGTPYQKWQFPPANSATEIGGLNQAPTLDVDGTLYFGTYGDTNVAPQLFALNPQDGSVKWGPITGHAGRFDSSPAIGSDGTIYIGEDMNSSCDCNETSNNGVILALSSVDGSIKWAFTNATSSLSLVTSFLSSPAISSDGTLYIGSDDLIFRAFNTANGLLVSTSAPCGSQTDPDSNVNLGFESSPVIAPNGVVYVGSWDGNLYAFCYETNVGLATSFWPMFRENRRHSGDAVDNRWTELPFPSATILALPLLNAANGTNWSAAYGVNSGNVAVGGDYEYVSLYGCWMEYPVRWINNVERSLGPLCECESAEADAVNDSGLAVGWGDDCSGTQWATYGSVSSGSMSKLSNPPGTWTMPGAEGVNNAGQIVGHAQNSSGYQHGVYWSSTSVTGQEMGTLSSSPSTSTSYAFGINNTGWIVGVSQTSSGVNHGFLTNAPNQLNSLAADLGTMSGSTSDYSAAYGINGVGQITGGSGTSSTATHAFLKYPFSGYSAGYQDLGTLGYSYARGTAISGRGQVGGVAANNSAGFLYVPGWANPTNVWNFLSSTDRSNWSIRGVFGVNHAGWLVGWGYYKGQKQAFAIYPNP